MQKGWKLQLKTERWSIASLTMWDGNADDKYKSSQYHWQGKWPRTTVSRHGNQAEHVGRYFYRSWYEEIDVVVTSKTCSAQWQSVVHKTVDKPSTYNNDTMKPATKLAHNKYQKPACSINVIYNTWHVSQGCDTLEDLSITCVNFQQIKYNFTST